MNRYEEILTSLLNCGIADIEMLKECKYDFDDIMEQITGINGYKNKDENINFNDTIQGAINVFREKIYNYIDYMLNSDEYTDKEKEELTEMQENVFEDIEMFINYIDTHIYINNEEIRKQYKKYDKLLNFINEENDNLGFCKLDLDN